MGIAHVSRNSSTPKSQAADLHSEAAENTHADRAEVSHRWLTARAFARRSARGMRKRRLVTLELDPGATTLPPPMRTTQPKPLFLLGDVTLDDDHRGLFEQIQAVLDSDNVALPTALRTLLALTEQHFDRENQLMAEHKYRGLRDHKAEHDLLLREFHRHMQRVDAGLVALGCTFVLERLVPWLEVHVPSMDCALVLHMQKQRG